MNHLPEVFTYFVQMAYSVEHNEAILIEESLFGIEDEEIWDVLFSILRDTQHHKVMLREIIKITGIGAQILSDERRETGWIKEFDHSDDFITNIIGELLKWEKWSYRFYTRLGKMNLDELSHEIGSEAVNEIKSILERLIEWEKSHIDLIEDLISSL